jgi:hypothetical protein
MTEKTLNGIELGISTALSIGVDYVVDKAITKAINPQTIPEKIITGIGVTGVDIACNYGIYKMVHGIMHPNENRKYEELIDEYAKAVGFNSEVAKIMAEHQVKIENSVDDIYKKMMEGTNG